MSDSSSTPPDVGWNNTINLGIAFHEYQLLMEGTDKITDRRQTVNTLFVSINALFLTGVGYLLLQSFQNAAHALWFIVGFLIIALFMTRINRTWLKLSESNRRLVDLRIRYLKQLEKHMRQGGVFPLVDVPLKDDEARVIGQHIEQSRGTYTVEDVLYNPDARNPALGFSRAEQLIGRLLTRAYWLAFMFAIVAFIVQVLLPLNGVKLPVWM